MRDKAARNEAYRKGLCVSCKTVPYSAGRTRCDECFAVFAVAIGGTTNQKGE